MRQRFRLKKISNPTMKTPTFLLAITLAGTTLSTGCTATSETPREVSCSREDVVVAALETIRRTASGYTYSDYIYPPRKLDYRPFAAYTDQLAGIPISLDHSETTESGSSGPFRRGNPLRCQATLAIEIPAEVAEVMKRSQYQKMRVLDNGKGRFGGSRIYFENLAYKIHETDDGSIKADLSSFNGAWSLHVITTLAVSGRHLILEDALKRYRAEDAELNRLWKKLPKDEQARELDAQRSWIRSKTDRCGPINTRPEDKNDSFERIDAIECHISMTTARIFEVRR